ncbi:MAG: ABC transporter permease [Lachnospiraceae bacterium]|nr:ABC transporter permease [Lachnospiraceae bacterium]
MTSMTDDSSNKLKTDEIQAGNPGTRSEKTGASQGDTSGTNARRATVGNLSTPYKVLTGIAFYVALILLWQVIYTLGTGVLDWWKPYAMPYPLGVVQSLRKLIVKGTLWQAVIYSLRRVLCGFAISLVIGSVLGLLISASSFLNRNLKPLMNGIQSLPSVCWVPFAILWFGLDESAILFVVVIGSTFSVALAIENAIQTIPPIYKRAAATMGTTPIQMYKEVIFPAALPGFLAGLRQSWSFAWRALMSGEVMSAYVGLGYTLMAGRDMADINQVTAVMLVIILIGILIDRCVFSALERRVLRKGGFMCSVKGMDGKPIKLVVFSLA